MGGWNFSGLGANPSAAGGPKQTDFGVVGGGPDTTITNPQLGEVPKAGGTRSTDGALGYLPDFMQQGQLLANEVEQRRRNTLGFLTESINRADQPTLTQGAIGALFSRGADMASSQSRDRMRSFFDQAGGQGAHGGGVIASAMAQIDLGRLAVRQGAMRDITIAKAQSDAQDRARRFTMDTEKAALMNQGPSLLGIDALGQGMSLMEARQQSRDALSAAQMGADATRQAGKDAKEGAIWGGFISGLARI